MAESAGPQASTDILAPAPVLALAAITLGVGLHWLRPVVLLPTPWRLAGGAVLVALGLGVLAAAGRAMRRAGTTPSHADEPPELLTDGPFAYSRNPIYLGILVAYVGLTVALGSPWPLLTFVPLAWYLDRVARREEATLEAAFGEEYRAYAGEVRRWL